MHAVVSEPLPEHDEKTDAVLMYAEQNVTVLSTDRIRTQVREVYKILRPGGRDYGEVFVPFNSPEQKVVNLHGWCIPAQGKDYEVKDKDAVELSVPKIEGAELVTDLRAKAIRIPAPDPGNVIGYEYEVESQPLVLQDAWEFQERAPVRESHYSLNLPAGWEYKASWLNYPEVTATAGVGGSTQWVVHDVKGVRGEEEMPPMQGVLGQLIVAFFPPGGLTARNGFSNWREMGIWMGNLENGRYAASTEMKQKVTELTSSAPNTLAKMRVLARFVQDDIRYVAIELGIGGWQPHVASDVFMHKYGDCKDKANLMRALLGEIGVEAYQVAINTERGSITPQTPAYRGFDHEITAIRLPSDVQDPSLIAIYQHPKLGRLLFFDPTDEVTPLGQIRGDLQANYALLVTPDGGELVELPEQPAIMNSIARSGKLSLDATGQLSGHISEVRLGDRAAAERFRLRTVTKDTDRIQPIESLLAGSLADFRITSATLVNPTRSDLPFGYEYSFQSSNYAQHAGNLLLVRPRVLGSRSSALLETKEPRQFPIEFPGPEKSSDTFDIAVPAGYVVDDLPPPVNVDFSFASYHSNTEASGNTIHYTRTFEIKELSVPVSKAGELKQLYRTIAGDERNTAVLKPVTP